MATTPTTAAPSEYHIRLAGHGAGTRAILLCERHPRHSGWEAAVELAYVRVDEAVIGTKGT
ncbi:hypothetical protein [Streptomyces sp. NPDC050538]|uniref:hypothetical protein n=1 Tax=Streptomyces sp. NPDC050538 TaxID=3365627 RepID=UPI0037A1FB51